VVGDYELTYRAEARFRFDGGGLVLGFAPSPPAEEEDTGCEQVAVTTTSGDASGQFYARFCLKPFLSVGALDRPGYCGATAAALAGVIIRSTGRVPKSR
jgi:hypothetical protein